MIWPFPEMNPSKMHNQNIVPLFDNFYPRWRISRFENSRFEKFLNKNGIFCLFISDDFAHVLFFWNWDAQRTMLVTGHLGVTSSQPELAIATKIRSLFWDPMVSFSDKMITWCHVTSSYLTITLVGSNRMESGLARQNNLS